MRIRTRMCVSLDGYVTTADGWPAQLADPAWSPEAFGFVEFQGECEAVLTGRKTFEPAFGADQWPWPGLDVFVLGSTRPEGTPPG
jgi:dihydrofolate reductase